MKINLLIITLLLLFLFSCEDSDVDLSTNSANGYVALGDFSTVSIKLEGDKYNEIVENPFIKTVDEPISTFSIDADGASYANVRRFIMQENTLPPKDAIRTEELINYFGLDYPFDESQHPIALNGEISNCPWNPSNQLVRIGIKGKPIPKADLPPSNFVFLIDVSGSMNDIDKLELLKSGFSLFVDQMSPEDRVAIVTYAGIDQVVLESTSGNEKETIKQAIHSLGAGGGTAGAAGIITAYEIAQKNFIENGNNRVILGTDGDFNIGISSQEELVELIEEKRDFGIYLTVLGVGRGNLNDAALEQIANNGNGTYEYIDNLAQIQKVFIHEFSKFYTVAKDIKVQIEFNADKVEAYRLIGYENRVLQNEDFENDQKDAGEIGADQNITALYEIVPINGVELREVPNFKIDFRYKLPNEDSSTPVTLSVFDEGNTFQKASPEMQFVAAVAGYSALLRDSDYQGEISYDLILDWLDAVQLNDSYGFKAEFKELVSITRSLK